MDMPLETPSQVAAGMPAVPVIIPLVGARDEKRENAPGLRSGGDQDTGVLPRFEFPDLPSAAEQPPKAIWPESDCPKAGRAYAELAESICWRLPPGRPMILAFSSPGDGDGKTSLLLSLAPELAKRTAAGVLAVDASFRKPDLTARLAISADRTSPGATRIYATNLWGLSVLPAPRANVGSVGVAVALPLRVRQCNCHPSKARNRRTSKGLGSSVCAKVGRWSLSMRLRWSTSSRRPC